MASMTHDELRELTGAYALGILSETERLALEAHLPTCQSCADEVLALKEVSGALAYAVPQIDPPAALRERVLREATRSDSAGAVTDDTRPVSGWSMPAWLSLAASIAVVALGLYTFTLRQRIADLETRLRAAIAQAENVQRDLVIAHASLGKAQQTNAIMAAGDVRVIDLAGTKTAPGARGRAFWSPSRGLVVAASLPAPPQGRQYQLWVIPPNSKNPISAGMLTLEPDGRVVAVADPAAAANVGTVAVTDEPPGGVPAPTGQMALAGSLQ